MNSLQKRKMGKEMRMNIQIGDYEVDSNILDLRSNVKILTNYSTLTEMIGIRKFQLCYGSTARLASG